METTRKDWIIGTIVTVFLLAISFNTLGSTSLDTPVDHDHYKVTDKNVGTVYKFEDYTFKFKERYGEDMDNGKRIGYTDLKGNVAIATDMTVRHTKPANTN